MSKQETPAIYVIRKGGALYPEMKLDHDTLMEFPAGERIKLTAHTARSPKRLRFYWAFIREVVKATECAPSAKAFHEVVKMETGYTDDVRLKGFTVKVPASIAFDKMDEPEFEIFLNNALRWIAETYGVTPESVKEAA